MVEGKTEENPRHGRGRKRWEERFLSRGVRAPPSSTLCPQVWCKQVLNPHHEEYPRAVREHATCWSLADNGPLHCRATSSLLVDVCHCYQASISGLEQGSRCLLDLHLYVSPEEDKCCGGRGLASLSAGIGAH